MTCPDCNNLMRTDGGCWACPACGHSACDCTSYGLPNGLRESDYNLEE